MADYHCAICGNRKGNQLVVAKELMYGSREEFLYFSCAACGVVQLADIQLDVSKYYPSSYYSFKQPVIKKYFLGRFLVNWYLKGPRFPGLHIIAHLKGYTAWIDLLKTLKKDAAILDVGCGSGELLCRFRTWGFQHLTGIDPYINEDISYPGRIKILKKDLLRHQGSYDLIMLHHSFEHMNNPREILKHLSLLLRPNGRILIRIPVADSFAFRKYGAHWYQLDAPRHVLLHTTKSIAMLGEECGLVLQQIISDSTKEQFLDSEKYLKGMTLWEEAEVSSAHKRSCKRWAKYLNGIHDGDQACFVLGKQR